MMKSLIRRALRFLNAPRHLAYVILTDWVFCSMAYWLIERHEDGGPTGPISGLWWGVVTASTVGYGDYSPATTAGRAAGAFLILSMWALVLIAGGLFAARAVEDNTPAAFTHDEQREMRRVDDETNFLVRQMWANQYGKDHLEMTARIFNEEWDSAHPDPEKEETA